MVKDTLSRSMRDLRISVTDRCSFRCVYCMPREVYDNHQYLDRSDILTYDEITRLTKIAVELGVTKVRLTGGEPLLRREIGTLVSMLAKIEGLNDLAMTTNALQLSKMANALVSAGLSRVTISLDAIDDAVFKKMIDTDVDVSVVLRAIEDASESGLGPIKINTVLRKGWNEDQILPLAEYFRGTPHVLRFIEYMDVGTTNQWVLDDVVTAAQVVETIQTEWPIEAIEAQYPGEVAKRWRYMDGEGEIGLIASVSQPFCGACTRLRLSAEGSIYTCLFAGAGTDLRGPMRDGATDVELAEIITSTWTTRDDRYSELRGGVAISDPKVEMSYIGG
ncbi:MAG: GTP 3',8-cyclase MoaA [Acidimicrobiia bacterium]|nr:GTP 3',8-cyclase MoaA [Acidimicrobiia bacterium]